MFVSEKFWELPASKRQKVELQSNITLQRKCCFNFKFLYHLPPFYLHTVWKSWFEESFAPSPLSKALQATLAWGGGWLRFHWSVTFRELGTEYPACTKYKDGRACGSWFGSNRHFITFMVEPYYSYGCTVYYIYGQILLHLVGAFITFMVKSYYIYG